MDAQSSLAATKIQASEEKVTNNPVTAHRHLGPSMPQVGSLMGKLLSSFLSFIQIFKNYFIRFHVPFLSLLILGGCMGVILVGV